MEDAIAVDLVDAEHGDDPDFVAQLADLVNEVYAAAESGLWRDGAQRTTATELADLIRAGEIAVATVDGRLVGSVRIQQIADDTGEFGMLVSADEHRGTGVGRALLEFAERTTRERGMQAMQLEVLVPRAWTHPSKQFLLAWYGRVGYRLIRTGSIEDAYPHLAPLLATPCDFEIHEKPLRPEGAHR